MSEEFVKPTMEELKAKFEAKEWALPTWTDFLLGQLEPNEVAIKDEKRFPRVRGLRRLGSYLAENVVINCSVISCNEEYAACRAEAMQPIRDNEYDRPIASSMAEATPANVNNPSIAKHLLATAESRAEGRCWTKVLKLNTLTAEEMSLDKESESDKVETVDIDEGGDEWNSDIQKKMINAKAKKLNMNIEAYAKFICESNELEVDKNISAKGLSDTLAKKVIQGLDAALKKEKFAAGTFAGYDSSYL